MARPDDAVVEEYVRQILGLAKDPGDLVPVATACIGFAAAVWTKTKGAGRKQEFLDFCAGAYDELGDHG